MLQSMGFFVSITYFHRGHSCKKASLHYKLSHIINSTLREHQHIARMALQSINQGL